jgi:uncharacterized heparinase superfamily protein
VTAGSKHRSPGAVLRKLSTMERAELLHRSGALLQQLHEDLRYRLGLPQPGEQAFRTRARRHPPSFARWWLDDRQMTEVAEHLNTCHPEHVELTVRAANRIRRGEYEIFGAAYRFPEGVRWTADPVSGQGWPHTFHGRVPVAGGDSRYGDFKHVWELNRHQFLVTLGKAWRLTGDDGHAAEAVRLVLDWIDGNPYNVGVNWTSALEVGVRALSWCWCAALIQGSPAMSPEGVTKLAEALALHAKYLREHLSVYSSPYNHLIGEACGLYAVGCVFDDLNRVTGWQELGWRALEDHLDRQFYPDGGSREQATGYHHFTLGFYLQALLLRRRLGGALSAHLWSRLEKAFEFSMHVTRPDGQVPMIGDGDEGKALDLYQPRVWDFRPYLAAGAILFERADFARVAGPMAPEVAWLFGCEAAARYDRLVSGLEDGGRRSVLLPHSGYAVMRTGPGARAHWSIFDFGEIADGVRPDEVPSAAHGHADALSLEVMVDGVPVLVDPGFFAYNGPSSWNRYFREAWAHNTVVVDGASQLEYAGHLKWARAPVVQLRHWTTSDGADCVDATHSGYQRLVEPVTHRRTVLFMKPDYWFIRDEFRGRGAHTFERYFHFAVQGVRRFGDSLVCAPASDRGGLLLLAGGSGGTCELLADGEGPDGGWIGTRYGGRIRAPVARFVQGAAVPIALHMLILPVPLQAVEDMVGQVDIGVTGGPGAEEVRVSAPGIDDRLVFNAKAEPITSAGGVFTDAEIAWVRTTPGGEPRGAGMVSGTMLTWRNEALLTATRRATRTTWLQ